MNATAGFWAHRQGHINGLCGKPRRQSRVRQVGLTGFESGGDLVLHSIEALSHFSARVGVELAETLHMLGDAPLLAQGGDPNLFKRVQGFRSGYGL